MKVHTLTEPITDPLCLMIGNYDGVHRGHQKIIRDAQAAAVEYGHQTAVLSFDPHPLKILAPERAPRLLQTPVQKEALLAHYDVDHYIALPFDKAFSQQTPHEFIAALKQKLNFKRLFVGFNFRFGRNRAGDVKLLAEMAAEFGFELEVQQPYTHDGETVSSSRVRKMVAEGVMDEAADLLGRPYFVDGVVGQGDKLGKSLKAPTANVQVTNEQLPRFGVYASWTLLDDTWRRSITNIGVAPTTGRNDVRFETHMLDFSGDIYGRYVFVSLSAFMRPEQRFDSLEQLKHQIASDIAARRDLPDTAAPDFRLNGF